MGEVADLLGKVSCSGWVWPALGWLKQIYEHLSILAAYGREMRQGLLTLTKPAGQPSDLSGSGVAATGTKPRCVERYCIGCTACQRECPHAGFQYQGPSEHLHAGLIPEHPLLVGVQD